MNDRRDEGSAAGSELLGLSNRLFHWWHKYRGGKMATCRRLLEDEKHLWTFLKVLETNNTAERALRHAVLWRKSSGGTASEWGSRFVERVLSVAATCRQQGRNVLEFLTECCRTQLLGNHIPSLLLGSRSSTAVA